MQGCDAGGKIKKEMVEVDWDQDNSVHIVCELYKEGERNQGAIAKS